MNEARPVSTSGFNAGDPAPLDAGLSPLGRARWRRAVLSELAEPGYIDFALGSSEEPVRLLAPTEVSPVAVKLLSLEGEAPWTQLLGDSAVAQSQGHLMEVCHSVVTFGRDAALTTQVIGGPVESIVVRKIFASKESVSIQLSCPTAMARLRAAESVLRSIDPALAPHPDGSAVRALVVDDNVDAATTMCEVLELLGFETAVAFSGPECLGIAALFNPHLTFMDFDMPGMDGCEALFQLRLQESEFRRTFICLTGRSAPEDYQKCRDAGFDDMVTKPISVDYLRRLAGPLID
jgi:CheY-like chemotaxis protein